MLRLRILATIVLSIVALFISIIPVQEEEILVKDTVEIVEEVGEEEVVIHRGEYCSSSYDCIPLAPYPASEEVVFELDREEVEAVARTLYGECRGIASDMEKAAVVWVILNRVDAGRGDIIEVIESPSQFTGYDPNHPLWDELIYLAEDVMTRWYREKAGDTEVGRVIPEGYQFFRGDGGRNYFREEYRSTDLWDWSLENPYSD